MNGELSNLDAELKGLFMEARYDDMRNTLKEWRDEEICSQPESYW